MENIALVIEDDKDLSVIFTTALEAVGFDTETIQDGEIAQQRLKEIVPNVDGSTLLKQIHADERLEKVDIIIAAADAVQAESYRDMATLVMVKPITFSQLRDSSARLKGR